MRFRRRSISIIIISKQTNLALFLCYSGALGLFASVRIIFERGGIIFCFLGDPLVNKKTKKGGLYMTIIREETKEIHPKKEKMYDFGEYLDPSRFSLPGECFTTKEKDIGW